MKISRNAGLVVAALLVAFLLAEIALRLIGFSPPNFYRQDIHTGAALRPGAEGWWREEGQSYVRINRAGMRDDREVTTEKPADVYRIAVLGDSYAEALQVDVAPKLSGGSWKASSTPAVLHPASGLRC